MAMRFRRLTCVLVAGMLATGTQGCAWIQSLLPTAPRAEGPDNPIAVPPMWLQGTAIKAITVATDDFIAGEQSALRQVEDNPELTPHAREVRQCLARIDGYDIQVRDEPGHYTVLLRPSSERCSGNYLLGGGAEYQVSKADFSILKKEVLE